MCPFVFSFYDPGPHGNGRYSEHMLPEVEMKDFSTGAQVYFLQANLTIWLYFLWQPFLFSQEQLKKIMQSIISYFSLLAA
jgi:hypothetical protein